MHSTKVTDAIVYALKSKSYRNDYCTFDDFCKANGVTRQAVYYQVKGYHRKTNHGVCVYFVACNGFVKIGKTTNLKRRMSTISTNSTSEPELLFTVDGDHETQFHDQFSEYRHRMEWFRVEGTLKQFIQDRMGN